MHKPQGMTSAMLMSGVDWVEPPSKRIQEDSSASEQCEELP